MSSHSSEPSSASTGSPTTPSAKSESFDDSTPSKTIPSMEGSSTILLPSAHDLSPSSSSAKPRPPIIRSLSLQPSRPHALSSTSRSVSQPLLTSLMRHARNRSGSGSILASPVPPSLLRKGYNNERLTLRAQSISRENDEMARLERSTTTINSALTVPKNSWVAKGAPSPTMGGPVTPPGTFKGWS